MATVIWLGSAQAVAQVDTLTVGSATAGHTFWVTINGKVLKYTAGSGETTTTVAAALQALLAASAEPEFAEIAWTTSTNTVVATGPAGGTPFTLSVAGGTGTFSRTATTTPTGPSDAANAANYSGGALPSAADHLVFEGPGAACLYGLTALAAVALGSVTRRATYAGPIGLGEQNPAGYREYRTRYFSANAPTILVEQPADDGAGQVRLDVVHTGSPATVTAVGDRAATGLGAEALEVFGLPTGSVVNVSGGSVAVAPLTGQAAAVATLRAVDSTVTVGGGVTLGAADFYNSTARVGSTLASLAVDGGTVTVTGAAAATTVTVDGGELVWRSTGSPGTVAVGGGGRIDFAAAPAAVALGGAATLAAGSAWNDPAGRVTGPYDLVLDRCQIAEVSLALGTQRTLTIDV